MRLLQPLQSALFRRSFSSMGAVGRVARRSTAVPAPRCVRLQARLMSETAGKVDTAAPKSTFEKLKGYVKMYGSVFVVTYIGVYISTLTLIFIAIKIGNASPPQPA